MAITLEEFYAEFFQEIVSSADAGGLFAEDAFFDLFCDHVVEAGDLDTADRQPFRSANGQLRVDGYGGDPKGSSGELSLIIADFNQSEEIGSLTQTDCDTLFKRLRRFLEKALDADFRNSLEESSPGFGLADMIAARWDGVTKVRMVLISNRQLSSRVKGMDASEFNGKQITFSIWDVDRVYRVAAEGHGREELIVDLSETTNGPPLILSAHLPDAGYETYLAVIPGLQLAEVYDKWGPRLLEQNVRVFLQARGKVNRGIRDTIDKAPEMFLAYNNGITATAEEIVTTNSSEGLRLTRLKNLQIVNGGQTTASIHTAFLRKSDLSRIFVQMKLSIVPPARVLEVVPKISEYANSQNKVNAADFFSNHPFHVRMEEFSRRLYAPSPDGTFRQSKWFYERARGQYNDARGNLTAAKRKKFDLDFPKAQLFSKTDLAKFINVWKCIPHTVSLGAQKNFAFFAHAVGKEWDKKPQSFNEDYFRDAVAKMIVFKATEKIVSDQPWYQGGYRANIVAYALSKMAHDVAVKKSSVDFALIWKKQTISDGMHDALAIVSEAMHEVLIDTPPQISNVTEWAKKEACWDVAKKIAVDWPDSWLSELVGAEEARERSKDAEKDQIQLDGIEAQTIVVNAGGAYWGEVLGWGTTNRLLSPDEASILQVAAAQPARMPTEKQCVRVVQTLTRLQQEGFDQELPGG